MLSEHIDGLYSYALGFRAIALMLRTWYRKPMFGAIPVAGRMRKESDVKSWMFAIMRNIWLNQLRQRAVSIRFCGTWVRAKDLTHCY